MSKKTKYHINYEGKIYPCRAKVMKCPYSESLHSDDKIELYYKVMNSKKNEVEPSKKGLDELKKLDRLKSLYVLSEDIENTDSPLEVLTYTLRKSLGKVLHHDVEGEAEDWRHYEERESEEVYDVLNSGFQIPPNVPDRIASLARSKFRHRRNEIPREYGRSGGSTQSKIDRRNLAAKDYGPYKHYRKWQLNEDNIDGTYKWMARDFEKFSHDLNTSRMITQPMFYGDIEKAKADIRDMDDYELLATFDDYSITDKEIEDNVKEANYFKYNKRRDLSDEANAKMKEWYDRNRKIYHNWKLNTPKRVLLSTEVAEELDRRSISRQDSSIDRMLSESKED